MRIVRYPKGIIGVTHVCDNCNCKFTINKRDINEKLQITCDGELFVECPVCENRISVSKLETPYEEVFDTIENILRNKAENIKSLNNGVVKDGLKEFVDDLYNSILEERENKKWRK